MAIKNMLLSLRQILHSDLSAVIAPLSHTVQEHEQMISNVETKMSEMFMAHTILVDAHADHKKELQQLKLKKRLRGQIKKE